MVNRSNEDDRDALRSLEAAVMVALWRDSTLTGELHDYPDEKRDSHVF